MRSVVAACALSGGSIERGQTLYGHDGKIDLSHDSVLNSVPSMLADSFTHELPETPKNSRWMVSGQRAQEVGMKQIRWRAQLRVQSWREVVTGLVQPRAKTRVQITFARGGPK